MPIGSNLRQAREAQDISLDQAAQATHIRLQYLEALEAERFEVLPSPAQQRGFLRAYASYLKLDAAALLRELDGGLPQAALLESEALPVESVSPPSSATSDAIFREIGEKLRSQRELMGLSLGDVERHTHIRMHYVQALEEGEISHLPSPVQGRGMLSNYASFLGLNTEAVLLRFADGLQASLYSRQAARKPTQPPPTPADTARIPARPSQFKRLFSIDLFASGFLILFILGFAVWGALRVSALRSNQDPSPTAPPVSELLVSTQGQVISATLTLAPDMLTTPSPAVSEIAPLEGATEVALAETPAVIEPTTVAENAPVQVVVVPRQRAWMRIIVDGEIVFEGRVVPGSAYSFGGNDRIELLTGDGASLQVYYNQQDLGIIGASGEVVEQVFSIAGVQTATPAVPPTLTPMPTGTITPTPTPTGTGVSPAPSPTLRP